VVRFVWHLVVDAMSGNDGSHDHEHVYRVTRTACYLWERLHAPRCPRTPTVDLMVCLLGALLHDWADRKLLKPGEEPSARLTKLGSLLKYKEVDPITIDKVIRIAANLSYNKRVAGTSDRPRSYAEFPEFFIVEDADYLDALGPVGELRCAMFCATRNQKIRNYATPSVADYMKSGKKLRSAQGDVTYIDHFQHKLLLLEDLMSTEPGREMARSLTQANVAHLYLLEASLDAHPVALSEGSIRLVGTE